MSADTIPAELVDILRGEIGAAMDVTEDGTAMSDPNFEMAVEDVVQAVIRVLADRSTRPAEPAAPVAEAGEVVAWGVEMYGFCELCNDEETARYRHEPARKVEPLARLSALEVERARADAAEARIVELEAVEKTLRWSVSDSEASLAAAEQRAAVALARAEKAEGALEATREDGWRSIMPEDCEVATVQTFGTITLRNSHPAWVRDDDGRTYEAVWTVDDRGRAYWWDIEAESPVDPVAIYPHPLAARASREAQPATDGGGNG